MSDDTPRTCGTCYWWCPGCATCLCPYGCPGPLSGEDRPMQVGVMRQRSWWVGMDSPTDRCQQAGKCREVRHGR